MEKILAPISMLLAISLLLSCEKVGSKPGGSIVAWGIEDGLELDFGQVTDSPAESGFVAVAAGAVHSLGIRKE